MAEKIYYSEKTKKFSQELRRNATEEENTLWYRFLRTYPVQFRRQQRIGSYIVDFFCHRAKLIIELDGGQHYEPEAMEYDRRRTEYLTKAGYTVFRFTNTDVKTNFRGVCTAIDEYVKNHVPSIPSPSGEGGAGGE